MKRIIEHQIRHPKLDLSAYSHYHYKLSMDSLHNDLPSVHVNGASGTNGAFHSHEVPPMQNGRSEVDEGPSRKDVPLAVCGMAVRLPGRVGSPQEFWDFLMAKGDAKGRVPESRYNISAYHSASGRPGTIATEYGYFLDESVKLGSLDASRFSLSRAELEFADPQQRLMLEVVREALDDAGEVNFKVGEHYPPDHTQFSLMWANPGQHDRMLHGKLRGGLAGDAK